MASDTLTVILNGDEITIEDLAEALQSFSSYVSILSKEIAEGVNVQWEISRLSTNSPITASVVGKASSSYFVERIVAAYGLIGEAVETNAPFPYSDRVADRVSELTQIINGNISSIELIADGRSSLIVDRFDIGAPPVDARESIGTVTGTVETVSIRGGVKATIYDPLFDRAIRCFLREQDRGFILNAMGKRVIIAGRIVRDPESGRALRVREIKYIKVPELPAPSSYKASLGILAWDDDEASEDAIRRMRDASS